MEVLIDNRQSRYTISLKKIEQTVQVVLSALECPDGELYILLVDDSEMAKINETYLGRLGPTNVIAFPMRAGRFSEITPSLLGDVVISADTAHREGQNAGLKMGDRLDQLLIHGILHLCGYDHENTKTEARRMDKKAEELLKVIKDLS